MEKINKGIFLLIIKEFYVLYGFDRERFNKLSYLRYLKSSHQLNHTVL